MGMAPAAHVLFSKIMKMNPANSAWINRDRFVLSNGHACALLYIMLHLTGHKLSMDDLKQFRQLNSKTPGHPESHETDGIETTTGPLGQGFANAVGFAIAQSHMAANFNKPGFDLFDNYTYVFCGDGCLQEGISSEAASLAGHLGLGRLIVIYDDNKVSIDGFTDLSFTEDVPKRFESYGWHTITVKDGDSDLSGIQAAVEAAQKVTDKPTIISLKTTIGFGASKQGTEHVHGSPLGNEDIPKVKAKLGLDPAKSFNVDDSVHQLYNEVKARGGELENKWNAMFSEYKNKFPKEAGDLERRLKGELPDGWKDKLPAYTPNDKPVATRALSGACLNALAPIVTDLVGGSADLTPSNNTELKCSHDYQKSTPEGRYIRFGVREHAMFAIGNGLSAYGCIIPYTATFLNFLEYGFPSVRLAALSQIRQIFVMTHDSIGLGEDGPTHQPIEVAALCRATPNLDFVRPADGNETSGSYQLALSNVRTPTVLALSRQNLPQLQGSDAQGVLKGGYVLQDSEGKADVILVATGSEVAQAVEAANKLKAQGKKVRVVSMPCTSVFDRQPVDYRRSVITPGVPTVSIEALATFGWEKYSHFQIGMTTFGASAPLKDVLTKFGFQPDQIATRVSQTLEKLGSFDGLNPVGALATHFQIESAPVNA